MQEIGNGREKADVCQEFGLVNSVIPMTWENRTTVIGASEKNRSRIKQFQKTE
jgi:ERCC4-type nuclease